MHEQPEERQNSDRTGLGWQGHVLGQSPAHLVAHDPRDKFRTTAESFPHPCLVLFNLTSSLKTNTEEAKNELADQ
jgi:hypothetical protein